MPRTFDPALARDIYSITIIQQVFDGLVQFDQNLNVIPAIAKSWKISPDGLTYTFYLRGGVKFHNGREIVAEDFVYSFTRMADLKTNLRQPICSKKFAVLIHSKMRRRTIYKDSDQ